MPDQHDLNILCSHRVKLTDKFVAAGTMAACIDLSVKRGLMHGSPYNQRAED
jgi:hypothetical protein